MLLTDDRSRAVSRAARSPVPGLAVRGARWIGWPASASRFASMTSVSIDPNVLAATDGYLVADARGRIVGRVEQASVAPDIQPRLTVRGRLPWRRRRIVLASDIDDVDPTSEVIALRVERDDLRQP